MAIGQAYEAIKYGKQTVMLAGGAEELSAPQVRRYSMFCWQPVVKMSIRKQSPRPI